jgi:glycosidase
MKSLIKLVLVVFAIGKISAQVVYTQPLFPVDGNDSVVIYFDATKGNQGLNNFTGDIYVHTGVVVASASSNAWSNVQTTWGTANAAWKVTPLGNNLYKYKIANLRSFYNVTAGQSIYKIAILFRDALGNQAGRNTDGSDIYIPVIQSGAFLGRFLQPTTSINIIPSGGSINSVFACSQTATISIFKNGTLLSLVNGKDSIHRAFTGTTGSNKIKAVAFNGTQTISDSFSFTVSPAVQTAALPSGLKDGINYIGNNTVTLVLVAPNKNNVYALGDFSNWELDTTYFMKKTPDGTRWWTTITNLIPNQKYAYQYLVDGDIKTADPYGEEVLDPFNDGFISPTVYPNLKPYPNGKTSDIVSIFQPGKTPYNWTSTATYVKPKKDNLVVYELLMRDFLASHSYHDLIDTIPYFKKLGVNVIEFMPINEFEGNESWGYNPSFYFAADKYYGPADSLKRFIDLCHKENIAVVMDQVLNHSFSQSPLCKLYWNANKFEPAANSPWYNADCDPVAPFYQGKHPFGVGYDFNHESQYTKKFFMDVMKYWVDEFKIDGYRFDLSKGFTQNFTGNNVSGWSSYDASRIAIWKNYADSIWAHDSSTYIILEHFADNAEETELANYGMLFWGNITNGYQESAMGYTSSNDINWVSYKARNWQKPGVVGYMESHDEERVPYKCLQFGNVSGNYNIKQAVTMLERLRLTASMFFTIPGPKMIWQFGELGYDFSINRCDNGTIDPNCRLAKKPIRWDYYTNDYNRKVLFNNYAALIHLKTKYPQTFNTSNFIFNGGNGIIKTLYLNHSSMNAAVVGNFGMTNQAASINFQTTGKWYDYYTGDSITVNSLPYSLNLNAGDFKIYTSKRIIRPNANDPLVGLEEVNLIDTKEQMYFDQAYPNPVLNQSIVKFGFTKETSVKIELLDITGRKIETLLKDKFRKGDYELEINADHYNNGVYIIKFTTESGITKSQKVTVNKR